MPRVRDVLLGSAVHPSANVGLVLIIFLAHTAAGAAAATAATAPPHQHDGGASSTKSHHEGASHDGASHANDASGHDGSCSGVTATLDREWEGGFALTMTSQPWRPKLALQLTLPHPGATLGTLSHASLHAAHPTGVSLIAAESPGVSSAGHIGAQLQFQGEWRGATAHCAKACIAAAVARLNGEHSHMQHSSSGGAEHESHESHDSHEHGSSDGGVLIWRVSPVVWSPKALVTVHTAEAVTLQRVSHATLVQHTSTLLQVELDAAPDDKGGFVMEMATLDGKPLSDIPYTSCRAINQPPSPPPLPPSSATAAATGHGGGHGGGGGGGGGGHGNGNGGQAARLDTLDGASRLASIGASPSFSPTSHLHGGPSLLGSSLPKKPFNFGALFGFIFVVVSLSVLAPTGLSLLRWMRERKRGRAGGGHELVGTDEEPVDGSAPNDTGA